MGAGLALNWNGPLLAGAVELEPKLNVDPPPNANVDGAEPNVGAAVDGVVNGKPLVVPAVATDVCIGLVVVFDVAPNANNDGVFVVEPKAGNDGTEVDVLSPVDGAAPNVAFAPNAGAGVVLLVDITEGANGFNGLPAPNANGVLPDVVVIPPDGKLKPGADDKLLPNKDAADVVAGPIEDADVDGKPLGNENPLVVEETGNVKGAVVVVGAVAYDGKANGFAGIELVVVVGNDDDEGGALVPNENEGGLSDEIVEGIEVGAVVVVVGVLPNDPNVIDVGNFIGDDDVVVIIEGVIEELVAVVVFADVTEPNDGNVAAAFIPIWNGLFAIVVAG